MKRKKRLFKLSAFLLSFIILFLYLYFSSNRILEEYALKSFISAISTVSYSAIDTIIEGGYDYSDLIEIEKNNDGDVSMVVTQSFKVNELAVLSAKKTFSLLESTLNNGVDIPLGAFSGIRMISGFGAKVNMKLLTASSVKCDIVSEFQSAGINQTRHLMYLNILAEATIVTKISTKSVNESIKILVYDNLIIGKVPSVLVSSSVIGSGNS